MFRQLENTRIPKPCNPQVKPDFKVECVTNGYPSLPNVQWYINGKRITSSSSIYDVQDRGYIKVTCK